MSTSTPVARPSRRQRKPRSDLKLGLTFILPATIGLVAFYIWPLIRGIWLSFTEYNLLTPEEFTGLDNYKRMVQDDTFWNAVVVTVEYVVINIGLQTILALLIAVLMQRLTQSTFVRSIVLTPYLVSNVVAAMLWLWILDNTLGITNQLLESLTGSAVDFFSSSMAIPTIAIINVWGGMWATRPCSSSRACSRSRTRSMRRARWTAPASGGCSGGSPSRCCVPSWLWCSS